MGVLEDVWNGLWSPVTGAAQSATANVVTLILWVVVCVVVAFMGLIILMKHPLGIASWPIGLVLIVVGLFLAFSKLGGI